jgi:hypothetical protein
MTCSAAIIHCSKTRAHVREYLASRGFQRTLEGWRNGRWSDDASVVTTAASGSRPGYRPHRALLLCARIL